MPDVDVRIRRADGLTDYLACVELQKKVWGYSEMEDIAAQPMLMIGDRFGGSVLIAEDSTSRAIGFAFAMPGWKRDGMRFWWSHMTAVVEEYRHRGVGLRLKLRQRDEALVAGISLIEWTFDPLQAMNAHFNICKLGVVVREYEENVYGETSSRLHRGLPTDRLVAEWSLNSDRVRERLDSTEQGVILRDLDRIQTINPSGSEPDLSLTGSPLLLEIPHDLNALKLNDLAGARQWQDRVRASCLHYFQRGYAMTDFILVNQRQAFYVLELCYKGG